MVESLRTTEPRPPCHEGDQRAGDKRHGCKHACSEKSDFPFTGHRPWYLGCFVLRVVQCSLLIAQNAPGLHPSGFWPLLTLEWQKCCSHAAEYSTSVLLFKWPRCWHWYYVVSRTIVEDIAARSVAAQTRLSDCLRDVRPPATCCCHHHLFRQRAPGWIGSAVGGRPDGSGSGHDCAEVACPVCQA